MRSVIKSGLTIFFCVLCVTILIVYPAHATQARVAHTNKLSSCGTSCVVTVTSTGTGHLLLITCYPAAAATTCSAASGGGTWVHPGSCAATSTTAVGAVDFLYALSSTSGATSVTVTFSAANGNVNAVEEAEYSTTATPWTFGGCGTPLSNQTATTSPHTPSINPAGAGTSNLIAGAIFTAGSVSAGSTVSGTGWTTPIVDAPGGDAYDDGLGVASGSTTATFTQTSGAYCSSAIWFYDASGGSSTTNKNKGWVF